MGIKLGGVQGVVLTLELAVTSGKAQGIISCARDQTRVD